MTPQRVQMSRQHPWRAEHPDAVIVARPSKWGNPFKIGGEYVVDDGVGLGVLDVDSAINAASAFHLWLTGEFDVREFAEWSMLYCPGFEGYDEDLARLAANRRLDPQDERMMANFIALGRRRATF